MITPMTLSRFNQKSQAQRAALVWEQGKFITVRLRGSCNICLYCMGKFFAEIWYRVADNEVHAVRGFISKACLEPYLEMVDLSDLTD